MALISFAPAPMQRARKVVCDTDTRYSVKTLTGPVEVYEIAQGP